MDEILKKHNALTQEKFIEKCNETHNYYYDYSKTKYTGANNKITITCLKHGDFEQKAQYHKSGGGCKHCSLSKEKKKIDYSKINFCGNKREKYEGRKTILYYVKINNFYKIGLTMGSVKSRFNKDKNIDLKILKEKIYDDGAIAFDKEQEILNTYKQYRIFDQTPLVSGNTEIFIIDILGIDSN